MAVRIDIEFYNLVAMDGLSLPDINLVIDDYYIECDRGCYWVSKEFFDHHYEFVDGEKYGQLAEIQMRSHLDPVLI